MVLRIQPPRLFAAGANTERIHFVGSVQAYAGSNKLWAIGEVTYRMDEQGTKAELVVMPKEAFEPEPVLLMPFYMDVPANVGRAKAP